MARIGQRPLVADTVRHLAPLDTWLHSRTRGRLSLTRVLGHEPLVLTTIGRRTGLPREVTLLYTRHGAAWGVIASNFGQRHHPAWSANLLANPSAVVTIGDRQSAVRARVATGTERDEIWSTARAQWPGYDAYAERAGREIRVFLLEPV